MKVRVVIRSAAGVLVREVVEAASTSDAAATVIELNRVALRQRKYAGFSIDVAPLNAASAELEGGAKCAA